MGQHLDFLSETSNLRREGEAEMLDGRGKTILERLAQIEQAFNDHEERHTRDHDELILARQNEVTLSAASSHPVDAVLKWVAGLVAAGLVALLVWLLKR